MNYPSSLIISFILVFDANYLLSDIMPVNKVSIIPADNGKDWFLPCYQFHNVKFLKISLINTARISFSFSVNDNKNSNTISLHASIGRSLSTRVKALNPMKVGDTQAIYVEPSKKDCQLTQTEYYVRKEYCFSYDPLNPFCDDQKAVYFYASLNNNWVRLSNTAKTFFKDQIGYIHCKVGFIEKVWVNGDKDPHPARGCGIATVFATLCMMDEELNLHDELKSRDVPDRIQYFFNYNKPLQQFIKNDCKRFFGLEMLVEKLSGSHPYSGAYAYFSAAIKSGYNEIFMRNDGAHVTDQLTDYIWRNTDDARDKYDAKTGNFGELVGREKNWWFCDLG